MKITAIDLLKNEDRYVSSNINQIITDLLTVNDQIKGMMKKIEQAKGRRL